MKLEGERIYLKPMSIDNAEIFMRWVNDPEVNKYMVGIKPPKKVEEEIEWIKKIQDNPNEEVWSIFIKENNKLIGNVGFHELDNPEKNLRIGIVIGEKDEWGKGYGTDVFNVAIKYLKDVKGAKKINLTCHINNIGAHKVYKKSGFKIKKQDEDMDYMEKKV
jgi:RimJ/RimL family protein N-acetyltransferase